MPLPAPYAPPWKRLGEDGVALLAWFGLKTRELWRRNREGLLPVPGFWPRRGRRLFWPLALLVALLGVGGVGRVWLAGSAAAPVERATASPPVVDATPPATPRPPREGDGSASGERPAEPRAASGDVDSPRDVDAPLDALPDRADAPEQGSAPPTATAELPEPPESPAEREGRRLRAAWGAEADTALILEFAPDPASTTLTLRLGEDLLALGAARRQQLVDRWRERAVEEGYSHLHLRDGSGRSWGRDALVGGGMILFDPPGPADDAP